MSIQDEIFPYDDLELSRNSEQHIPRASKLAKYRVKDVIFVANEEKSTCDQDKSTESSNSCTPESETSRKTNAIEPAGNSDTEPKRTEHVRNNHNKSVSYQDIHSEYIKRRYKHVESKVGQYIANIKDVDKKKRNSVKFQRHRSMPATLSGPSAGEPVPEQRRTPKKEETKEKSTQTENIVTPSPGPPLANGNEMFVNPLTLDSNSNSFDHAAVRMLAPAGLKVHKTVATIQPLSLYFSNLVEQDNSRECSVNNTMASGNTGATDDFADRGGSNKDRSHKTLRTLIKRLFGACTKCEDPDMSMFSQIPLLEKSVSNSSQKLR